MSNTKRFQDITKANISALGVQALADRPNRHNQYGTSGLDAKALKAWFDNLSTLSAEKINTIHQVLFSPEAAEYIALRYSEMGMDNLQDFISKFIEGTATEEILKVFPTLGAEEKISLQSAIYNLGKSISDLGYGYTDATVEHIEDGGEADATVEIEDYEGGKRLKFIFYNLNSLKFSEVPIYLGQLVFPPEGLIYEFDEDHYNIVGYNGFLGETVYLPNKYRGYPVHIVSFTLTAAVNTLLISDGLNIPTGSISTTNGAALGRVIIGNNVTIGSSVFKDKSVSHVIVEGHGVVIGESAFENASMNFIDLKNPATIKARAFANNNIKSINVPSGTTIGDHAFYNNANGGLIIVNSDCELGNYCFYKYVGALGKINIADRVKVGNYAFYSAETPTTISIGEDCVLGSSSFRRATYTTSLTAKSAEISIGDRTKIGEYAFYNLDRNILNAGKNLEIGNYAFAREADIYNSRSKLFHFISAKSIGEFAFLHNYGSSSGSDLTVTITEDCKQIGDGAFAIVRHHENALGLSYAIEGNPALGESLFKHVYGEDEETSVKDILMPHVEIIGRYAFHDATVRGTLDISGCKKIEEGAFDFWSPPTEIIWSSSLEEVEGYILGTYLRQLPSFMLPKTLKKVAPYAFKGVKPQNTNTFLEFYCRGCHFSDSAFLGIASSNWAGIKIDNLSDFLSNTYENANASPMTSISRLYDITGTQLTDITIPRDVYKLNKFALRGLDLTAVRFEHTPNSIAENAFNDRVGSIYMPWSEGEVPGAPWGATKATLFYNR